MPHTFVSIACAFIFVCWLIGWLLISDGFPFFFIGIASGFYLWLVVSFWLLFCSTHFVFWKWIPSIANNQPLILCHYVIVAWKWWVQGRRRYVYVLLFAFKFACLVDCCLASNWLLTFVFFKYSFPWFHFIWWWIVGFLFSIFSIGTAFWIFFSIGCPLLIFGNRFALRLLCWLQRWVDCWFAWMLLHCLQFLSDAPLSIAFHFSLDFLFDCWSLFFLSQFCFWIWIVGWLLAFLFTCLCFGAFDFWIWLIVDFYLPFQLSASFQIPPAGVSFSDDRDWTINHRIDCTVASSQVIGEFQAE